jgi:hypothetical protein
VLELGVRSPQLELRRLEHFVISRAHAKNLLKHATMHLDLGMILTMRRDAMKRGQLARSCVPKRMQTLTGVM